MTHASQQGMTLPELLIALTLLALLGAIAVPSFGRLMHTQQQQVLRDRLYRSLEHVRTLAVNDRRQIEICASTNGRSCQGDWDSGWILRVAATEEILARESLNPSNPTARLQWKGYSQTIRFRSNGTSPSSNGRFTLCTDKGLAWQIVINRQGRIRLTDESENQKEPFRCN
jgi:type IV fimbrial biogenesis protein FimT